jgi:CLIP-associating protein 1/2
LKTFLDTQASRTRQTIEHTSGLLDMLIDSVTKGLSDVNPGVRETARPAYWSFHTIWPAKALEIVDKLDGIQKKQLDKVRPSDAPPIPVARPPIGAAKRSSGIGALLAEKRKAAMAARQEVQRTVSSPITGSPSLAQNRPTPRSTSSHIASNSAPLDDDELLAPSQAAPIATPSRPSGSNHSLIPSPSGSTPTGASPGGSPLRQTDSLSRLSGHGQKSPTPSVSTSSQASRSNHKTQPRQLNGRSSLTPEVAHKAAPSDRALQESQAAQAAQGVMAARQLLDVDDDDGPVNPVTPSKPPRSMVQNALLQTPSNGNGNGRNIWEDSPGPSAVTPMMLDKLKGRRHERSWWIKRQQCTCLGGRDSSAIEFADL